MISIKVNYNYFTLYKNSSLNLKIIWSKRELSVFVFFRCRIQRFEVVGYSEKWFHFLLLKCMDENWSLFLIYKSCQRESKINYYSWFFSRGTGRLRKWIHKERYELLLLKRNNLMTAWKPLSWNLCHVRPLSNVELPMSAEHLFQSMKVIKYGRWFRRRLWWCRI